MSETPSQGNMSERRSTWASVFAAAAVCLCVFEIAWFWRFCGRNITADAVSYIGLARHLLDGHFIASLHGYWSPLISWLIAAIGLVTSNLTFAGHAVTIASLLILIPLLYWLSSRLWRTPLAAGAALLWFVLARGIVAMATCSILADFMLAAAVSLYFIVLLKSLREDRTRNWLVLGTAHALAFLAKAIAMPWLALTTLMAALMTCRSSWRKFVATALLALVLPACIWVGFGSLLKLKYGYFTTGYQLRYNLIVDSRRYIRQPDPTSLMDTSRLSDQYLVTEVPQSQLRSFHMLNPSLITVVAGNERRNLPNAVKEVVILLTPGGVLCLLLVGIGLVRHRQRFPAEFRFALLVTFSCVTLILAYCMLVFDSRYVLPLIPPLIAIGSIAITQFSGEFEALVPGPAIQKTLLVLLAAGAIFFQVYWASPFRTITRDFQSACYDAARQLRQRQPEGKTLVSIGSGPFPERGVGREVGNYTAYHARRHLLADAEEITESNNIPALAREVASYHADAVLVWGSPASDRYQKLLEALGRTLDVQSSAPITDPEKGEVGTILFASK